MQPFERDAICRCLGLGAHIYPLPVIRMRLAIIITTLNSEKWMKVCLDSIGSSTYKDKITVVVDGASRDNTVSFVRKQYPEVVVIACPKNYGYAGGNDIGIGYAMSLGVEYVFIANPDIRLEPTCLERLVLAMDENPDFAVLGPMNYGIVEDNLDPHFRSRIQKETTYLGDLADNSCVRFYPLRYVEGCGMLIRCETLKQFGLFDPAYVVYGDDLDLCARIRFHGGKVMLDTSARLWHLNPRGPSANPRIQFYGTRGEAMNRLKKPGDGFVRRLARTEWNLAAMLWFAIHRKPGGCGLWPVIKAIAWIHLFFPHIVSRRRRELKPDISPKEFLLGQLYWPVYGKS